MPKVNVTEIANKNSHLVIEEWIAPLVCSLCQKSNFIHSSRVVATDLRKKASRKQDVKSEFVWGDFDEACKRVRRSYQNPKITELATLALACYLADEYLGLKIQEVTLWGDSADYWLENNLLIEISGQSHGNLSGLHKSKVSQLKRNRLGEDGYVCVTNYERGQAILSYHACNQ